MRRQPTAFFLGDVAFLADRRFRRLAKLLPDQDDFLSAVGAFWTAIAIARGQGAREIDAREETGSKYIDLLEQVGLLVPDGIPAKPWEEWSGKDQHQSVAARARAQGPRDERGRLVSTRLEGLSIPLSTLSTPAHPAGESTRLDILRSDVHPGGETVHPPFPSVILSSSSLSENHGESVPSADPLWHQAQRLVEELTGKPYALANPFGGLGSFALDQVRAVGWERFSAAYRQVASMFDPPTTRQLVFGAEDLLRPVVPVKPPKVDPEIEEGKATIARISAKRGNDANS